jgi:hypothetical protein
MATFYYVTAIAPATLLVSGRRMQLQSGDSRGPFTELEVQQIMSGPDRRRLVTTPHQSPEDNPPPVVSPTQVNGLGVKTEPTSEVQEQIVPQSGKDYADSKGAPSLDTPDKVQVLSNDVNEPLTAIEKEAVESSITEVLPESPVDESISPTSTASLVYDDKPPVEEEEEEEEEEEKNESEDENSTSTKKLATRSRRRKSS